MDNQSQPGRLAGAPGRLKPFRAGPLLALVTAAGLIAAACGGGDSSEDQTAQPSLPSTAALTVTPGQAAGSALKVIGKDITFDKTELEANSGAVSVEFDNQDDAIPHNFHVFKGTGPSGDSVDLTKITSGPVVQTLDLQIEPGAYFFKCDVHPNQMKGTLVVS